jgi:hypothetical protein
MIIEENERKGYNKGIEKVKTLIYSLVEWEKEYNKQFTLFIHRSTN